VIRLIYVRRGVNEDPVELCVHDGMNYRVFGLSLAEAYQLSESMAELVRSDVGEALSRIPRKHRPRP
jgi:hypothetical protein